MTSVTPTGGTTENYTYTGLGQAELTRSSQTTFQNSSIGPLASTYNAATSYYTRDPNGQLIAIRTATGAEYYPTFDGIGSVTNLIDTTGAVAATWSYGPYGKLLASSGATGANRFRYAGGWQDGTTSYYHFGDRWYDPKTGRWTQQDPIAHLGDLTQGDQYAYAGDNPVNAVDPSGKSLLGDLFTAVDLGSLLTNASEGNDAGLIGDLAGAVAGLATSFVCNVALGYADLPTGGLATALGEAGCEAAEFAVGQVVSHGVESSLE